MKDNSIYLEHIIEAINRTEIAVQNTPDKDSFLDDKNWQTREVVFRQIEIIGEAVRKLSAAFREAHDEVPWKQVASMRNHLIHEYFAINEEKVWETIQKDIPILKQQIEQLLNTVV